MLAFEYLSGRTSPQAEVRLLSAGATADGSKVYWIKDRPTVLKVSPPSFPRVIGEETQKARRAREALGKDIAKPIPTPIDQWVANGVTCALFEELEPISSHWLIRKIQLKRIAPLVLDWLRDVAIVDRGISRDAETKLRALGSCPSGALRTAANGALAKIESEKIALQSRVMHGDLWHGNILFDPFGAREFIVIDWRGSAVDGLPIFDLVKFAESARLRPSQLRYELAIHARILGCELEHTRTYLLAALGHIWLNLDQFPPQRFVEMGENNLRFLNAALNG